MRFFALLLLVAAAARADQNDLELWRLGHPDDLACTRCDGLAGDSIEPGTIDAQARFHRLTSALGLAFAPPFQETAGSLGESGFELGISCTWERSSSTVRRRSARIASTAMTPKATAPNVPMRAIGR